MPSALRISQEYPIEAGLLVAYDDKYLLLRELLTRQGIRDYQITRSSLGTKPQLRLREDSSARPLYFSLSDSARLSACVLSTERELGLDLQVFSAPRPRVIQRCFNAEETRILYSSPAEERARCFTSIWAKKEAYAKYLGLGLSLDFKSIDTTRLDFQSSYLRDDSGSDYCLALYLAPIT